MGYFKSLLDSFRGIIIEAKRIPLKVRFLVFRIYTYIVKPYDCYFYFQILY